MRFTSTNAKSLRPWALLAVAGNVATVIVAAVALPDSAHGLLPVLGLGLPFLTSAMLELAGNSPARESSQPRFERSSRSGATARHVLT
jgi:hypothetical protein